MSSRSATRLAWGAWAASVVLTSARRAFVVSTVRTPTRANDRIAGR